VSAGKFLGLIVTDDYLHGERLSAIFHAVGSQKFYSDEQRPLLTLPFEGQGGVGFALGKTDEAKTFLDEISKCYGVTRDDIYDAYKAAIYHRQRATVASKTEVENVYTYQEIKDLTEGVEPDDVPNVVREAIQKKDRYGVYYNR